MRGLGPLDRHRGPHIDLLADHGQPPGDAEGGGLPGGDVGVLVGRDVQRGDERGHREVGGVHDRRPEAVVPAALVGLDRRHVDADPRGHQFGVRRGGRRGRSVVVYGAPPAAHGPQVALDGSGAPNGVDVGQASDEVLDHPVAGDRTFDDAEVVDLHVGHRVGSLGQ